MQDIITVRVELSQYHSGQIIEQAASMLRNHEGAWSAVISVHDRSTGDGWQHTVTTHGTRAEAESEIRQAGLITSATMDRRHSMQRLTHLVRALGAHAMLELVCHPKDETLAYRFGAEPYQRVPIEGAEQHIVADALARYGDIEIGRWNGDEFVRSAGKTARIRTALANL